MLNFNSLLVFSEDPKKLADFYKKVFDKDPEWEGDGYTSFKVGSAYISIGPHDKVHGKSKEPERLMFNLETNDVKSEFERIKGIEGAEVIADPYGDEEKPAEEGGGLIATFADPDGNYFQLMSPMPEDWKQLITFRAQARKYNIFEFCLLNFDLTQLYDELGSFFLPESEVTA